MTSREIRRSINSPFLNSSCHTFHVPHFPVPHFSLPHFFPLVCSTLQPTGWSAHYLPRSSSSPRHRGSTPVSTLAPSKRPSLCALMCAPRAAICAPRVCPRSAGARAVRCRSFFAPRPCPWTESTPIPRITRTTRPARTASPLHAGVRPTLPPASSCAARRSRRPPFSAVRFGR